MKWVNTVVMVTLVLTVLTLFKVYVLHRPVTFESIIEEWALMSVVGILSMWRSSKAEK